MPPSWLLCTPGSDCPGSQHFFSRLTLPHPTPAAAPTSSSVRGSSLPYPISETTLQSKRLSWEVEVPKYCPPPRTACLLKSVCLMITPVVPPGKSSHMPANPSEAGKYTGLSRVLLTSAVIAGEGVVREGEGAAGYQDFNTKAGPSHSYCQTQRSVQPVH